ncbi:MAG: type I restriction enzyme HsdR N-terminal domain-containing protein [Proteobacteria bacterium]|nr:type I restriction enzyme HsdR N-terminal domain-containing protein [Pseudomonadota bacterium]
MNDHHLILGSLIDFISGKEIPDTLDERYRQAIAERLVRDKQFKRTDIVQDYSLTVTTPEKKAILKIDFIVLIDKKELMLIKYGPGSIITRHRSSLAASRLVAPHQIPCVVVTNGEDADILLGRTGTLLAQGLDRIPSRNELALMASKEPLEVIDSKRSVLESRILYAFEVDGSCPCDTDICRIEYEP